jgi:7-cyano-7-deazaguanine synthase in queuosine biosynthesis
MKITEQQQPTTIIQLSGGIDSAYVLYEWLKNNPNEYCLVHHIKLKNHEGRISMESKAVKSILKWLTDNGITNYIYLESGFDYGNLGFIIKDVEVCGFFLGVIIRNNKWTKIKEILMPIYKPEAGKRHTRAQNIRKMVGFNKKYIEVKFPIKHLEKVDVLKMIPKDLFELCWWCRTPVESNVCGKCKTCKEVQDALAKID